MAWGFILLLSPNLFGQSVDVTGRVSSQTGEAIIGASVIAQALKSGRIVDYSISTLNGTYFLSIPDSVNSYKIKVTHLSFESKDTILAIVSPFGEIQLDWTLSPSDFELPEIVVRREPVIRHGDTIVYDLSQFREQSTEDLGMVLDRIPGIEVQEGGKILYDGLPISRLYIEGLDMMGGRYGIITRNLSADAIRDVEILERHQHIRALDSLFRPPNAAINLRLKRKVALTAKSEATLGYRPALYQGKTQLFGFQPQQQFGIFGSVNNIGKNNSVQYIDQFSVDDIRPELLSATLPLPSLIGVGRDNREVTGSVNLLRRTGSNSTLQFQSYLSKDRIRMGGINRIEFLTEVGGNTIQQSLTSSSSPLIGGGTLRFEMNKPQAYLQNKLNVSFENREDKVTNETDGQHITENLSFDDFTVTGNLLGIIRRKNNAFEFRTDYGFSRRNYDLMVSPLPIGATELGIEESAVALQDLTTEQFDIDAYTLLYRKSKRFRFRFRAGIKHSHLKLQSQLQIDSLSRADTSLSLENNITQQVVGPYGKSNIEYDLGRQRTLSLSVPLHLGLYTINSAFDDGETREWFPTFHPQLTFERIGPKGEQIGVGYALAHGTGKISPFYNGYILRNSRNLQTRIPVFNRYWRHDLTGSWSKISPIRGSEIRHSLKLSALRSQVLGVADLSQSGLINTQRTDLNTQYRLSYLGSFATPIANNWQVGGGVNAAHFLTPFEVNERLLNVQNTEVYAHLLLTYLNGGSVISLKPGYKFFQSTLSSGPLQRLEVRGIWYHRFRKGKTDIKLTTTYHQWHLGRDQARINTVVDLVCTHEFKKLGLRGEIGLYNVTGTKSVIQAFQYGYFRDVNTTLLQPTRLLFRLVKEF